MIITTREDIPDHNKIGHSTQNQTASTEDRQLADSTVDGNGMRQDDVFDQLADEDHVVTSGRGSRLPVTDSDGGTTPSGYSAGVGSGSGAD